MPVRVKKTRQNERLEPGSDSIRTDKALVRNQAGREVAGCDCNGMPRTHHHRGVFMQKPVKPRSAGLALIVAAIFTVSAALRSEAQAAEVPIIAIAEIQYVDTSGEIIDQGADHLRRLREFEVALRTDLAASGKVRNVALDCPPNAIS
jgi:hypothetical protein